MCSHRSQCVPTEQPWQSPVMAYTHRKAMCGHWSQCALTEQPCAVTDHGMHSPNSNMRSSITCTHWWAMCGQSTRCTLTEQSCAVTDHGVHSPCTVVNLLCAHWTTKCGHWSHAHSLNSQVWSLNTHALTKLSRVVINTAKTICVNCWLKRSWWDDCQTWNSKSRFVYFWATVDYQCNTRIVIPIPTMWTCEFYLIKKD